MGLPEAQEIKGREMFFTLIKRVAFSFRSFRNYRIRTLLDAGKPDWSLLATIEPR